MQGCGRARYAVSASSCHPILRRYHAAGFNRRMRKTARPVVWEGDRAQSRSLDLISRVPWAVAAALAVVATLALGWVAWRATRPVERPLMRFSADLGPEAVAGPSVTAAISRDGTRLAFVARGPGGKQQLATRLLDRAQATLLPGTENAADPFFS